MSNDPLKKISELSPEELISLLDLDYEKIGDSFISLSNQANDLMEKLKDNPEFLAFLETAEELVNLTEKQAIELGRKMNLSPEEKKALIVSNFFYPNSLVYLNPKEFHEIFKHNRYYSEGKLVHIKDDVFTYLEIKFPNPETELTPIDKQFINTAFSFLHHGVITFSTKQLCKYRTGKEPSEKELQKARESLDKMKVGILSHKWEKLAKKFNYEKLKGLSEEELISITATEEDYLLPLRKRTISINGHITDDAYEFICEPYLYKYAQLTGQIYEVDRKLLDPSKSLPNSFVSTDKNETIKDYIKDAIFTSDRKIIVRKLDTLYEKCNIFSENQSPKAIQKNKDNARKTIKLLLDHLQKEEIISKHEFKKEGSGNTYTHLYIELPKTYRNTRKKKSKSKS